MFLLLQLFLLVFGGTFVFYFFLLLVLGLIVSDLFLESSFLLLYTTLPRSLVSIPGFTEVLSFDRVLNSGSNGSIAKIYPRILFVIKFKELYSRDIIQTIVFGGSCEYSLDIVLFLFYLKIFKLDGTTVFDLLHDLIFTNILYSRSLFGFFDTIKFLSDTVLVEDSTFNSKYGMFSDEHGLWLYEEALVDSVVYLNALKNKIGCWLDECNSSILEFNVKIELFSSLDFLIKNLRLADTNFDLKSQARYSRNIKNEVLYFLEVLILFIQQAQELAFLQGFLPSLMIGFISFFISRSIAHEFLIHGVYGYPEFPQAFLYLSVFINDYMPALNIFTEFLLLALQEFVETSQALPVLKNNVLYIEYPHPLKNLLVFMFLASIFFKYVREFLFCDDWFDYFKNKTSAEFREVVLFSNYRSYRFELFTLENVFRRLLALAFLLLHRQFKSNPLYYRFVYLPVIYNPTHIDSLFFLEVFIDANFFIAFTVRQVLEPVYYLRDCMILLKTSIIFSFLTAAINLRSFRIEVPRDGAISSARALILASAHLFTLFFFLSRPSIFKLSQSCVFWFLVGTGCFVSLLRVSIETFLIKNFNPVICIYMFFLLLVVELFIFDIKNKLYSAVLELPHTRNSIFLKFHFLVYGGYARHELLSRKPDNLLFFSPQKAKRFPDLIFKNFFHHAFSFYPRTHKIYIAFLQASVETLWVDDYKIRYGKLWMSFFLLECTFSTYFKIFVGVYKHRHFFKFAFILYLPVLLSIYLRFFKVSKLVSSVLFIRTGSFFLGQFLFAIFQCSRLYRHQAFIFLVLDFYLSTLRIIQKELKLFLVLYGLPLGAIEPEVFDYTKSALGVPVMHVIPVEFYPTLVHFYINFADIERRHILPITSQISKADIEKGYAAAAFSYPRAAQRHSVRLKLVLIGRLPTIIVPVGFVFIESIFMTLDKNIGRLVEEVVESEKTPAIAVGADLDLLFLVVVLIEETLVSGLYDLPFRIFSGLLFFCINFIITRFFYFLKETLKVKAPDWFFSFSASTPHIINTDISLLLLEVYNRNLSIELSFHTPQIRDYCRIVDVIKEYTFKFLQPLHVVPAILAMRFLVNLFFSWEEAKKFELLNYPVNLSMAGFTSTESGFFYSGFTRIFNFLYFVNQRLCLATDFLLTTSLLTTHREFFFTKFCIFFMFIKLGGLSSTRGMLALSHFYFFNLLDIQFSSVISSIFIERFIPVHISILDRFNLYFFSSFFNLYFVFHVASYYRHLNEPRYPYETIDEGVNFAIDVQREFRKIRPTALKALNRTSEFYAKALITIPVLRLFPSILGLLEFLKFLDSNLSLYNRESILPVFPVYDTTMPPKYLTLRLLSFNWWYPKILSIDGRRTRLIARLIASIVAPYTIKTHPGDFRAFKHVTLPKFIGGGSIRIPREVRHFDAFFFSEFWNLVNLLLAKLISSAYPLVGFKKFGLDGNLLNHILGTNYDVLVYIKMFVFIERFSLKRVSRALKYNKKHFFYGTKFQFIGPFLEYLQAFSAYTLATHASDFFYTTYWGYDIKSIFAGLPYILLYSHKAYRKAIGPYYYFTTSFIADLCWTLLRESVEATTTVALAKDTDQTAMCESLLYTIFYLNISLVLPTINSIIERIVREEEKRIEPLLKKFNDFSDVVRLCFEDDYTEEFADIILDERETDPEQEIYAFVEEVMILQDLGRLYFKENLILENKVLFEEFCAELKAVLSSINLI